MKIVSDTVEIYLIDLNDTTFKITTNISTDDLVESIKNLGLISTPILKRKADNGYTVVSGFRRVDACRSLGWQHIDARIICEAENNLMCFKLAVADNALNRPLNMIEQAVSISKLSKFYADEIILSREIKKTGLNVNPGLIKKLKKINTLHNELKNKLAAGVISLAIGLELGEVGHGTATAFLQIFAALNPTLNHQKEMIRLTKEISKLNNVSMTEVINDCHIMDTINDPELDRNQKIKKIRLKLKQVRYPEIVRFEKNYATLLQHIQLPESIHLIPPADFEGNNFSMRLAFQNQDQFRDINNRLNKLQDHPDFARILEKEFEDN